MYGDDLPRFKKVIKANVIIMYDINAPDGEDAKNNKTYVHYLEVDDKEIINYQRPDPFKGVHNYYSVSIKCDDEDTLDKLKGLNRNDRTPEIYKNYIKIKK